MNLENKFLDIINKSYQLEKDQIKKALAFAKNAHNGQLRESGEPYVNHPISVAIILTEYGLDAPAIIAALLHDVLEDTPTTQKQIKEAFGNEVEELVKGVTKISSIKKYLSSEERDIESLRRLFVSTAKDIRVVLVKLADRLHNMRTLQFLNAQRQQKVAKETKEIYVPLAERLGLCSMRGELEDLCLKYLMPKEYKDLETNLLKKYTKRKTLIEEIEKELRGLLKDLGIKGEVYGRFKHFSSIYNKLQKMGTEKIYDIIAHRVIVNNVKECYEVLGSVHNKWKPVPGRIKDYIANPKVNGYKSLHTTVLTKDGIPFEIQIRTYEMHKICEYGVAAHWRYKDGGKNNNDLNNKLESIKQIIDSNKKLKDSKNFLNMVAMDLGTNEIWVFTPKRKVINLPENSTPIDFAYAIHTSLGHRCIGAKVNDKIVSLATKLETGDVIEILTSPNPKAPSRDWLNFVRSANARNKIRSYFKHEMKSENIQRGKEMLELEAKNRKYSYSNLETKESLRAIFKTYNFKSIEDMYASVGVGSLTTNQIIGRMIEEKTKSEKILKKSSTINKLQPQKTTISNQGILVYGEEDVIVRLCKNCSPLPGDNIVGFSVGKGITIHREGCDCIKTIPKERKITVSWMDGENNLNYNLNLEIKIEDKSSVLSSVLNALSAKNYYISTITAKTHAKTFAIVKLSVLVKNLQQFQDIKNILSQIQGILEIKRY